MNNKNKENIILLTAIEFACDATIACRRQINNLDHGIEIDEEKCGSRLAILAEVIKRDILKNVDASSLKTSEFIIKVSSTIEETSKDLQAQLYAKLFFTFGKSLETIEGDIPANAWIVAFDNAVKAIKDDCTGTEFYETLLFTKNSFIAECQKSEISHSNVLRALEAATFVTQQSTNSFFDITSSHKHHDYLGFAAAYAVGIWFRGLYEGIKLKFQSYQKKHFVNEILEIY